MAKREANATAAAVSAIEAAARELGSAMPPEFPKLLYGRTVAEDLTALSPALLARAAEAAYAHLNGRRSPGEPNLRFRDETVDEAGRERQITILEVVNDNKPFLLHSTLAELAE